jgi:hypothetical protein
MYLTKIIRFQGLGNLGKKMHLYSLCYHPGEFNALLSTQSKDVKDILRAEGNCRLLIKLAKTGSGRV